MDVVLNINLEIGNQKMVANTILLNLIISKFNIFMLIFFFDNFFFNFMDNNK
jgi:hypothetical protein